MKASKEITNVIRLDRENIRLIQNNRINSEFVQSNMFSLIQKNEQAVLAIMRCMEDNILHRHIEFIIVPKSAMSTIMDEISSLKFLSEIRKFHWSQNAVILFPEPINHTGAVDFDIVGSLNVEGLVVCKNKSNDLNVIPINNGRSILSDGVKTISFSDYKQSNSPYDLKDLILATAYLIKKNKIQSFTVSGEGECLSILREENKTDMDQTMNAIMQNRQFESIEDLSSFFEKEFVGKNIDQVKEKFTSSSIDEESPEAHFWDKYRKSGDRKFLKKLLAVRPDDSEVLFELAQMEEAPKIKTQYLEKALQNEREMEKQWRDNLNAGKTTIVPASGLIKKILVQLGDTYEQAEEYQKGIMCFEACLEIDPHDSHAIFKLYGLFFLKKDLAKFKELRRMSGKKAEEVFTSFADFICLFLEGAEQSLIEKILLEDVATKNQYLLPLMTGQLDRTPYMDYQGYSYNSPEEALELIVYYGIVIEKNPKIMDFILKVFMEKLKIPVKRASFLGEKVYANIYELEVKEGPGFLGIAMDSFSSYIFMLGLDTKLGEKTYLKFISNLINDKKFKELENNFHIISSFGPKEIDSFRALLRGRGKISFHSTEGFEVMSEVVSRHFAEKANVDFKPVLFS